jgi:hypothetical protein
MLGMASTLASAPEDSLSEAEDLLRIADPGSHTGLIGLQPAGTPDRFSRIQNVYTHYCIDIFSS